MSCDMAKAVKLLYARSWPPPQQVWNYSRWIEVPDCAILLSVLVTGSPLAAQRVAVLERSSAWRTVSRFSANLGVARLPGRGYILLVVARRHSPLKPAGSVLLLSMRSCAAMDGTFSRPREFCERWLSMDWDTARSPNRLLVRLWSSFVRNREQAWHPHLASLIRLLLRHAGRQEPLWSLVQGK